MKDKIFGFRKLRYQAELQIWDVYPGSRIFSHPGSRISSNPTKQEGGKINLVSYLFSSFSASKLKNYKNYFRFHRKRYIN
jgi:hypothetical protein